MFSGKANIIFPDNTRKIIFQNDIFGKTIFSGRLEKNMVFGAVKVTLSCFVFKRLGLCKNSKLSDVVICAILAWI